MQFCQEWLAKVEWVIGPVLGTVGDAAPEAAVAVARRLAHHFSLGKHLSWCVERERAQIKMSDGQDLPPGHINSPPLLRHACHGALLDGVFLVGRVVPLIAFYKQVNSLCAKSECALFVLCAKRVATAVEYHGKIFKPYRVWVCSGQLKLR